MKILKSMQDLPEFVLQKREQYHKSNTQAPHVVHSELKLEASFKKMAEVGFYSLSADIFNSIVMFFVSFN